MPKVDLVAGVPVRLTVQGRTLSIVNDPLLALSKDGISGWVTGIPDVAAGSVLVIIEDGTATAADSDLIVPPFTCATIPITRGARTVTLFYPPRGNPGGNMPPWLSWNWPSMEAARTRFTQQSKTTGVVSLAVAWSDAEGPLAITPTGTMIPRQVGPASDNNDLALPLDYGGRLVPPSAATGVYDQDVGRARGGPFFRPHIAPSAVSSAYWSPAATTTLYPAALVNTLGVTDPFNPAASPLALCRAILKINVTVDSTAAGLLVIGTASLAVSVNPADSNELVRLHYVPGGFYTIDFGEGLAPNFSEAGQFKYWYAGASGPAFSVMVIHG